MSISSSFAASSQDHSNLNTQRKGAHSNFSYDYVVRVGSRDFLSCESKQQIHCRYGYISTIRQTYRYLCSSILGPSIRYNTRYNIWVTWVPNFFKAASIRSTPRPGEAALCPEPRPDEISTSVLLSLTAPMVVRVVRLTLDFVDSSTRSSSCGSISCLLCSVWCCSKKSVNGFRDRKNNKRRRRRE